MSDFQLKCIHSDTAIQMHEYVLKLTHY